jgi:hypothetical protein
VIDTTLNPLALSSDRKSASTRSYPPGKFIIVMSRSLAGDGLLPAETTPLRLSSQEVNEGNDSKFRMKNRGFTSP